MRTESTRLLVLGVCGLGVLFGIDGAIRGSSQSEAPPLSQPPKSEPGKAKRADKDLAAARMELEAARKELAEIKQEMATSKAEQAATQSKFAELTRTDEILRKELESEKELSKAAAAKLDLSTREVVQMKAALNAAQKALTEAKTAQTKSQADQKVLAEIKQELATSKTDQAAVQSQMAELSRASENLRKELESERALSKAAAAKLDLSTKEVVHMQAEVSAVQKALTDARNAQTKSQTELVTNQKQLAETNKAVDGLQKNLEAEKTHNQDAIAKLKAAKEEASQLQEELATAKRGLTKNRTELAEAAKFQETLHKEVEAIKEHSKAADAKVELMTKEVTRTKSELAQAQKTLAAQPPVPATILVTLPAEARLSFDDNATLSSGDRRLFVSPALALGRSYYYTLKAEVLRDGKTVTSEKRVAVRAGEQTEVILTLPSTGDVGKRP